MRYKRQFNLILAYINAISEEFEDFQDSPYFRVKFQHRCEGDSHITLEYDFENKCFRAERFLKGISFKPIKEIGHLTSYPSYEEADEDLLDFFTERLVLEWKEIKKRYNEIIFDKYKDERTIKYFFG